MVLSICPCCAGPALTTWLIGIISFLLCGVMHKVFQKNGMWLIKALLLVTFLIVATLGSLSLSDDLRSRFFAFWFAIASRDEILDHYRCGPIASLSGRILEIGPGAGANFRCWSDASKHHITKWEGIEVNTFFEPHITHSQQLNNITFPTHIHWIDQTASNLQIDRNSFDAVVMTHVLCSVDNVNAVLSTIAFALKPNASLYFLEHVQSTAAQYQNSHEKYTFWQQLFTPLISIIGNNCQFKDTGRYLELAVGTEGIMSGYHMNLTYFEAPIPLPPLKPHITGTITKPIDFGSNT